MNGGERAYATLVIPNIHGATSAKCLNFFLIEMVHTEVGNGGNIEQPPEEDLGFSRKIP